MKILLIIAASLVNALANEETNIWMTMGQRVDIVTKDIIQPQFEHDYTFPFMEPSENKQ